MEKPPEVSRRGALVSNPLLRLVQWRLQNYLARLWKDKPELLTVSALLVLAGTFVLGALYSLFDESRPWLERRFHLADLALPAMLASLAAAAGSWTGSTQQWSRWAQGAWRTLPVRPRAIANGLLVVALVESLLWFLFAVVVTLELSSVLTVPWWSGFRRTLLGLLLLLPVAAVVRLSIDSLLHAATDVRLSPALLHALTVTATLIVLQFFVALWAIAYLVPSATWIVAVLLTACALAMAAGLRTLFANHWPSMTRAFETLTVGRPRRRQSRTVIRLVNRLASPLTRLITIFNLFSSIHISRFRARVSIGGTRLYALLGFFVAAVLALLFLFGLSVYLSASIVVAVGGGILAAMFAGAGLPELLPLSRLMRPLPVSFGAWIRSLALAPLVMAAAVLVVTAILSALVSPAGALRSVVVSGTVVLLLAPLRFFICLRFVSSRRLADNTYAILLGLGIVVLFQASIALLIPLLIAASLFFAVRARGDWHNAELDVYGS